MGPARSRQLCDPVKQSVPVMFWRSAAVSPTFEQEGPAGARRSRAPVSHLVPDLIPTPSPRLQVRTKITEPLSNHPAVPCGCADASLADGVNKRCVAQRDIRRRERLQVGCAISLSVKDVVRPRDRALKRVQRLLLTPRGAFASPRPDERCRCDPASSPEAYFTSKSTSPTPPPTRRPDIPPAATGHGRGRTLSALP
ncbi:hypothetical protein AAFF_G00166100 [Aldrovandia affinis]|uniref:Uncharacterized protein n=1 Tax=Aldrovandia affinis TaxID=143900 RepID=A0AAD7RMJ1_9TELE|nr:hypothetical protein AAFF_G00166100 [Aldrovandia affinis]